MQNWLDELKKLPEEYISVQHNPMTARYSRAINKLWLILGRGQVVGKTNLDEKRSTKEIAVWCESPEGKRCGYYGCFRIFCNKQGVPLTATMYCFYDGTEQSPCLKSRENATTYAKDHGFI